MLSLSHCQRIFLARAATDMRKGARSLSVLVRDQLGQDPLSGDLFIFVSKRKNYVKVLSWDTTGYWLAAKRLEQGIYALGKGLPSDRDAEGALPLSVAEVMNLLEGINVHHASYHQHHAVTPARLHPTVESSSPS